MSFIVYAAIFAQSIPIPEWDRLTVIGLLGLIVMSFLNRWVITKGEHTSNEVKHEKQLIEKDKQIEAKDSQIVYWRDMALENLALANRAVTLAEKQVQQ